MRLSTSAPVLFLASLLVMSACDPTTPSGNTPDPDTEMPEPDTEAIPDPTTCDEAENAVDLALERIQSCEADAECGQVLTGTSCGCTRDLVARTDADTTRIYELIDAQADLGCGGFISTCDCPATDGFACVNNTCSWNYTRQ